MTTHSSTGNEQLSTRDRALWTAIALLAATFVGVTAGILTWAGGVATPLAVVAGGAAFGTTVSLFLMLVKYIADNN